MHGRSPGFNEKTALSCVRLQDPKGRRSVNLTTTRKNACSDTEKDHTTHLHPNPYTGMSLSSSSTSSVFPRIPITLS